MQQYLLFALLGLGAGAVYAGLGMGLVTVFKGSGVVNFAQASLGLWGAFTFERLHRTGELVLPLVGLPGTVDLGAPLRLAPALAIGVFASAALGAATHLLVFRPLGTAPIVAKIMATIGVFTLVQAVLIRRFGVDARLVEPILPSGSVPLGGLSLPVDRLWLLGICIAVGTLLTAYFRWTLPGLATRAGVESETALSLAGWSPNRLAALNWALGSATTALLLTLASPITSLNPSSIGLLVVPGLAAMLVGRLSSVAAAAVGGLALGILQSELVFLQLQPWWPAGIPSGAIDTVPFVVIVVVLVLAGRRLPQRGASVLDPLPAVVRRPLRPGVLAGGLLTACLVAAVLGPVERSGLVASAVFSVLALSLVVLVGLIGQVSLGQAAIAGISAFVLARATDGLPFPLSVALAAVVATAAGVLMGLPALRVRGAQLAVVTLAGAVVVEQLVLRNAAADLQQMELEPAALASLDLAFQRGSDIGRLPFAIAVLAVLAGCCWLVSRIITGSTGRRFLAVRSNERAAAAVGINVASTKVLAFAVSSFLAGVGGALLAHSRGAVSAESFSFFAGITFLLYAFLGGITSVGGALVAGVGAPAGLAFVVVDRAVDLGQVYDIIGGLLLILAAVLQPEGVAGATGKALRGLRAGRPRAVPRSRSSVTVDTDLVTVLDPDHPALELHDVSVRYGGVVAVSALAMTVAPGQIVGLIGPNGAGKTSTLDAISGFARSTGAVRLNGEEVQDLPPHQRYARGMARTWQSTELFGDLTVLDNVLVAAHTPRPRDLWRDLLPKRSGDASDAAWALRLLGLEHVADRLPHELSAGQQKLVGVARALANRPSVLLADEPAAGLDSVETNELGRHLAAVARAGVAVVLVEHDLSLVLSICDHVLVLDFGQTIASGSPGDVRSDAAVIKAYVGTAPTGVGRDGSPLARAEQRT